MNKIFLFIVIVILALGAGVFLGFMIPRSELEKSINQVSQNNNSQPETISVTVCGSGGYGVSEENTAKVTNCIQSNFKSCSPASWDLSLDLGPLGGVITYQYLIIGIQNNQCVVKSQFLKNPNPDFLAKEMICGYDNSLDFNTAVQDTSRCSGPLYDLLNVGEEATFSTGGSIQDTTELPSVEIKTKQ